MAGFKFNNFNIFALVCGFLFAVFLLSLLSATAIYALWNYVIVAVFPTVIKFTFFQCWIVSVVLAIIIPK